MSIILYKSLKCPCTGNTLVSQQNPCEFTRCLNNSSVELTLSGFSDFNWPSREPAFDGHTQMLEDIDGTFTLKHYDKVNAGKLEKNIFARTLGLRNSDGGCHVYVGMPEILRFHTVRTNPDAASWVTPTHTTIAMFPVAGYFLGGNLENTAGRVNELVVQLGCILIRNTREPFPYDELTLEEYLALQESISSMPAENRPGWAVRRAPDIQLPVSFHLPVTDQSGSDIFPLKGVPGGTSLLDGRYACALSVSSNLSGLLAPWSGKLIYSTTLDYGAAQRPGGKPLEPHDPFLNGSWQMENPQGDDESDAEYLARQEAAQEEFAQRYQEYKEELEAYQTALQTWETENNFSSNDWENTLVYGEKGSFHTGTFFGIWSDRCSPYNGTKPESYPRTAFFSLQLTGCSNLGELQEENLIVQEKAEAEIPSIWKLADIPVYGDQYGGTYPDYLNPDPDNPDPDNPAPDNPDPDNPDPDNPDPDNPDPDNPDPDNPDPDNPDPDNPDPDNPDPEPEIGKWYLGFSNYWYFASLEHFTMDDTLKLSYTHSELRSSWCYRTDITVWCNASEETPPEGTGASECRLYSDIRTDVNPTSGALPGTPFFSTKQEALNYAEQSGIYSETSSVAGGAALSLSHVYDLHCGKITVAKQAAMYAGFTGDVGDISGRYRLGNCLMGECDRECIN